jgi:multiple sugar transport system substrate-binding protein
VNLDDINSPLPARKVSEKVPEEKTESELPQKEILENESNISDSSDSKVSTPIVVKDNFWSKNKKLMMILGGVVVLVLLVVLVVGLRKPKEEEQVVLNYWGLWESEEIMNGVISDYEAKNPNVKINYKRSQLENYRTRLASRLENGDTEGTDSVDIFRIHNTWIPMFRNYLESVPNDVVNSIGLATDFFNVYSSDLKENGKWLSVPLMYDGLALFYNKDLLKEANVEIPRSWWELGEAAIKLTVRDERENIKIAGAGIGTANSNVEHWSDILGLMTKQNGINFAKNVNTDKNLEDALKYYVSFTKNDQNVWDNSLPNSTEMFANGKLAFYFGNSWRVFDLANLNKDLNYGITTIPQLPINGNITDRNAELTNIHWASYWTEGVSNKSKNKEAAWKFLEYLSSKEVLEKLYAAESQTRSFGEIYPRRSMMDELKDNPKVWPFVSVADSADSWYLASATGDNGVNTEMQKYFTDVVNNLEDYTSNTETLTTLKNGISQLQQKYSLKR